MSRSRRSTGSTGAVRGPASALTSFLAVSPVNSPLFQSFDLFYQGLGVEPSARLTTWGNSSAINREQDGSASGSVALAHDGPMLTNNDVLDPAGAVTARTVEAGPSQVGEGFPDVQGLSAGEEIANGTGKRRIDESVRRFSSALHQSGLNVRGLILRRRVQIHLIRRYCRQNGLVESVLHRSTRRISMPI